MSVTILITKITTSKLLFMISLILELTKIYLFYIA